MAESRSCVIGVDYLLAKFEVFSMCQQCLFHRLATEFETFKGTSMGEKMSIKYNYKIIIIFLRYGLWNISYSTATTLTLSSHTRVIVGTLH